MSITVHELTHAIANKNNSSVVKFDIDGIIFDNYEIKNIDHWRSGADGLKIIDDSSTFILQKDGDVGTETPPPVCPDFQQEIDNINNEISVIQDDVSSLQDDVSNLQNDISILEDNTTTNANDISVLQNDLLKNTNKINDVDLLANKNKHKIRDLKNDLNEFVFDLQILTGSVNEEIGNRIQAINDLDTDLQNSKNSIANDIQTLQTDLSNETLLRETDVSNINNELHSIRTDLSNVNEVPLPVSAGRALVSTGANTYDFKLMDASVDAPITQSYFNNNAFRNDFKGIVEYAGVFPSGTDDPTNIVNNYNASTHQSLFGGETFIRFFDSVEGGLPEV